jgi:sigma-54 specific flagellar transcriptional regulator A
LSQRNAGSLTQYAGEERQWLADARLFLRLSPLFAGVGSIDRSGMAQPRQPMPVTFADEALALLREQGFDRTEAVRYFGLFYQLRRAYRFIDGALIGSSPCMQATAAGAVEQRIRLRYAGVRALSVEPDGGFFDPDTGRDRQRQRFGGGGHRPFGIHPVRSRQQSLSSTAITDTFIAVNLAEFPESLIESELFGHRKGAFTGAVEDHQGVFARCSPYGSLFLDEIGDASLGVQIKLLRVLQERAFTPVGSHKPQRFSGRVIAATHQALAELRQQGKFRPDFFYRLCSDTITVPPLRQRLAETPAELDLLVHALVARLLGSSQFGSGRVGVDCAAS